MIPRLLAQKASQLLEKFPLIAITGPRQSGKTTLARLLRPDYTYVNLELPENRDFAQGDPNAFLEMYQGGVMVQKSRHIQRSSQRLPG